MYNLQIGWGISSTVLVSLLFGLALVLVNSWFNRLIYFIKTVIIIQQIIEGRLTSSVVQNDIAIYYLFRQMSLCVLIFLALVNKVSENTKQRNLFSKKSDFVHNFVFCSWGGDSCSHIF
ncbi:diguanylate cyclase [Escherichia coli]|nr:diguanylate cyclase [Escherichia coli]